MEVPAWKKLGLKVKNVVKNDPLAVVTVRETVAPTTTETKAKTKQDKKEKTKKRKADDSTTEKKEKKPAKRVKLPKSERLQLKKEKANNIEKDQLHYLRQFKEDKENWKFSKQKQNWIIKNIKEIPDDYEDMMFEYLDSIKGGSRDRVVEDMKKVIEAWNKMVDDAEEQLKKDLEKTEKDEAKEDEEKEEEETKQNDKSQQQKKKKQVKKEKPKKKAEIEKETPPDYDYAVRAREVYKVLSGETLPFKSVDPVEVEIEEETVDVEDHI